MWKSKSAEKVGKKKFPAAPVVIASALVLLVSVMASCGNSDSGEKANNSKPDAAQTVTMPPVLTAAEKKAWVEKNVPAVKNDIRQWLPFTDIMGMPLDTVKQAVEGSLKDSYSTETSVYSEFSELSRYTTSSTISYRFSTRSFNANNNDSGDIWGYLVGGMINSADVANEKAIYYYICTDGSSKQIVNKVFVIATHQNMDFEEIKASFSNKLSGGEEIENGIIKYFGLVGEPDYNDMYNYFSGNSTKKPSGIGYVELYNNTSKSVGNSILLCIISS